MQFIKSVKEIFLTLIKFIFGHKKVFFIYLPLVIFLLIVLYSGYIYTEWLGDKDKALDKLAKYKILIDKTEENKTGYKYARNEVEVGAKVVKIPTRIYDRNGEIIGEFFDEKREIVPFYFIPKHLVNGVIASEDRDFYNHKGISYWGIFRAVIKNVVNLQVVQGGSSLTQQLAKVLFTDMERSLKRKIYEAYCALEIEKLYDKEDILSMYLNLIYFGNGSYGVESVSKMFFGKSVRELNLPESLMVVATISNPGVYSPLTNLNRSLNKTKRILISYSDAGFLKHDQIDKIFDDFKKEWGVVDENNTAVSSKIGSFTYSSYRINRSPFFNEMIRRELAERFGDETIKKGGLSIHTTIDLRKQDVALRALKKSVLAQREYHEKIAKARKNPADSQKDMEKARNIEGALVSLDPFTGEILSYVGGYEFTSENQNDNVYQIRRQPGSSIKPVVYASAIEDKKITPSTVFTDKKITYANNYTPQNYSNTFIGDIIIRQALVKSLNTITVQVLDKTGYSTPFKIIQKALLIPSSEMDKRFGKTLSFALGAYELSPLENAALHAVLINGGELVIPYGIKNVKDYNGNIVWDNEREVKELLDSKRDSIGKIIDPGAARITISMLEGIKEPDSTAYWLVKKYGINFPCAGKTGTSSNYVDAWFVGYNQDMITAIWIGNKTGAVSLGSGRSASAVAAPVWAEYVSEVYRDNKPPDFNSDFANITSEKICLDSGEVAGRNNECPKTAVQYFYSGSEPGKFCSLHVHNNQ
ncbi:MAG: transglycosylase domain-containing protein [Spirochaetes bacterium]|nr:transglycosylase domain-containing protein [Spirochaetota bacterium]